MKKPYWVLSNGGIGEYEIIRGEPPHSSEAAGIHGPFDTFGEAKKWAIEGCQTDITTARKAIAALRNLKKTDCEEV